ncbi:Aldehyde/histidinol dehydrogenase [Elsinoe ampelina]|uniref:Aldehyde/histidinol dehydrogenase n=1 Tax=Elsinoe ampelina TaxID=302913 RepID=A0A6A6FZJ2_9PEZI|nr:Aldehyde/histidinol dehydrogenase [Elsinoe ampelina]
MSQQELAALKAAAIDGRAQTIFYKHAQLQKLRDTLVEKSKQIQDAIVSDSGFTPAEAKIEYSLALNTLRTRYAEIADHEKVLSQEYTVAKGKDDASRRLGTGIALIKPASHNLFFSTIAPLVAAIVAGNVVVLQFENSTRSLPALLKSIIPPALDHDSIVFTTSTPQLDLPHTIVTSANTESLPSNHIASPTSTLSVALVDRNADFDAAARALINARFSFRGRSPHAPDLVLVNEFVKKDLLQALVRAGIASTDSTPLGNGALEKRKQSDASLRSLISDLEKNDGRVIVQESTGAVIDIPRRSDKLLNRKIDQPALLIHSIRSLDDAIDFLTSNGQSYLTAAYFADLGSGKYLSQFIPAQASFLNSIPAEVLVGPAFPLGWPASPDASDRYIPDMFSTARPAFVSAGKLQGAELTASTGERNKVVQKLYLEATQELKIKKRSKQLAAGFGFFEQAFLTHFGFAILTTLASLGVAGYWLKTGRGWRPWR